MKNRILAIDASTSNVGYTIGLGEELVDINSYQPKGKDVHEKLVDFYVWLRKELKCGFGWFGKEGKIDILFYEYPSGNTFHKSTMLLGALWHYAVIASRLTETRFIEIRPKEIKSTGVYKVWNQKTKTVNIERLGKAKRWDEFEVIKKSNGVINSAAMAKQDDMIDSIGCWLAGLERLRNED